MVDHILRNKKEGVLVFLIPVLVVVCVVIYVIINPLRVPTILRMYMYISKNVKEEKIVDYVDDLNKKNGIKSVYHVYSDKYEVFVYGRGDMNLILDNLGWKCDTSYDNSYYDFIRIDYSFPMEIRDNIINCYVSITPPYKWSFYLRGDNLYKFKFVDIKSMPLIIMGYGKWNLSFKVEENLLWIMIILVIMFIIYVNPIETKGEYLIARLLQFLVFLGIWLIIYNMFIVYVNLDEIEHLYNANLVRNGYMPYKDFFEHHQPLLWYFIASIFSLNIPMYTKIILGRFLMLLFSLIGVVYFYRIAQKVNKELGMIALIFYLLNPSVNLVMFQIRPDVPAIALFLMGFYYFIEKRYWLSSLFHSIAFLFSVKIMGFIGLLIIGGLIVGFYRRDMWKYIIIVISVFVLYSLILSLKIGFGTYKDLIFTINSFTLRYRPIYYLFFREDGINVGTLLVWGVFIGFVSHIFAFLKKRESLISIFVSLIVLLSLFVSFRNFVNSNYLFMFYPFFSLFLIIFLYKIYGNKAKIVFIPVMLLMLALFFSNELRFIKARIYDGFYSRMEITDFINNYSDSKLEVWDGRNISIYNSLYFTNPSLFKKYGDYIMIKGFYPTFWDRLKEDRRLFISYSIIDMGTNWKDIGGIYVKIKRD